MVLQSVDFRAIRNRAFALANAEYPLSYRLLLPARATAYRRYLLWCVYGIAPKAVLRRLVRAGFRWRLLSEWLTIVRQYAVVQHALDSRCSLGDLGTAIWAEIDARNAAWLGDANSPASLTVLAKLSHAPEIQDRLAAALRERRVEIIRGKIVVRIRAQVATIVVLFLSASGWLTLVFSQVPQIRNDGSRATMMAFLALALLTYLFWPLIRLIAEDKRLRDVVNRAPHIR